MSRAGRLAGRVAGVLVVVPLVVVAGGGAVYAYWTTTGTGSGTGSATTFQPVQVTTGSAPGGQLYPGLVADGTVGGDLVVSASNPNPFAVTVTVSQSGPATGCTTPAVSMSGSASFTLPASSGTVTRTLPKVLSMGTSASNDCQGKAITVPLAVSSSS